jgi:hypothetical protein
MENYFARKCSATGEGMNEGYVFREGEEYFKEEKDLVDFLRGLDEYNTDLSDEFLLKEAYDLEEYYYTEWEEDFQYQLVDGVLIELED